MKSILSTISTTLLVINGCFAFEELTLKVPPLSKAQPTISSIYRISTDVFVSTEKWISSERRYENKFWQMDYESGEFQRFMDDKGNPVVAIAEGGRNELYASLGNGEINFIFPTAPKRNQVIPLNTHSSFRLCANSLFIYQIFSDKIVSISSSGKTESIDLKGLIPDEWLVMPRAIAVTDREIILGYDKGEWGGSVFSLKIDQAGVEANSRSLLSENICSISLDSKNGVWIASGLSHMGLQNAGLFFYDGTNVTDIISQRGFLEKVKSVSETALTSLPQATEISGMTINSRDEAVIVAAETGIFSYRMGKSLKQLWEGNLYISYKMPEYGVGSFPQGIVESGSNLYIASRSLGVICFKKIAGEKYIPIKQITFKKNESNQQVEPIVKTPVDEVKVQSTQAHP